MTRHIIWQTRLCVFFRSSVVDYTARCKAMAAFCSQRARMEDESEAEAFWLSEAEAWPARLARRLASAAKQPEPSRARRRSRVPAELIP